MIVGIHQPNYLPWLGYMHKIYHSDIFIFFDNTQVPRGSFFNRVNILAGGKAYLLTVPIKSSGDLNLMIKDCQINNNIKWKKKHWSTIKYSYQKAAYFEKYADKFKELIFKDYENLAEFNIDLIKLLTDCFGIKDKKFIVGSSLNVKGTKNQLLINMLKKVGATTYLSGTGAKEYMVIKDYEDNGIKVVFQKFTHPIYKQTVLNFVPNLSSLDLLFNHGPNALKILLENDIQFEKR